MSLTTAVGVQTGGRCVNLDAPIESYVRADGTLHRIPRVGSASTRVVMEVQKTGRSEIVEHQIEASDRASEVAKSRRLCEHLLTRVQVAAALADKKSRGLALEQYRVDCLFTLDSDAHGEADFAYAETAFPHSRLARVSVGRVINAGPRD